MCPVALFLPVRESLQAAESWREGRHTVLISDTFSDGDARFLIRIIQAHRLSKLNAESIRIRASASESAKIPQISPIISPSPYVWVNIPISNKLSKLRVAIASKKFNGVRSHLVYLRGIRSVLLV